ncbi:glycosyl hydrolase family 95 catalytic domain-containing protein [Streptomyces sp. CA-111067]|uniref:glycosyl hydrolase family 95 catalytic domain-containing protein n=1 Tax=Streptomyces sp. CA-111067 TaxID=3240046 RepID=UPI003D959A04
MSLARSAGSAITAAALIGTALTTVLSQPATADSITANQGRSTVAQYQGVWNSPPTTLTGGGTVDAPLMGNGDVGVAVGGGIGNQTFYLGKNDFFSLSSHAIKPLGRIVLSVPGMNSASYHVVQDIAHAQVKGTYTLGGATLSTTSWVSATENLFVTSMTLSGGSAQSASFTVQNGSGAAPTVSSSGGVLNADVAADGSSGAPLARIASKVIGGSPSVSGNKINVSLQPGTTYTFAASTLSSIDTGSYQANATSMVSGLQQADVNNLSTSHQNWWSDFWSQSYVQIPDKAVEKSWYGSLYLLGCVSRSGKYAPGLWGNWITGNMNWNGDYHTNYNYQAPFYAALTTNHIPLMDPYDQPVLDWTARGQQLAQQNGFQGVLYPVGLSPKGTSADTNLHNQKSNAANVASDMVMRFEQTRDTAYAAKVYPFLKQVGLFWQNYLTKDSSGTYTITNDAPQEDNAYPQTNSILSLGLVHLLMQGLSDMSTALGQDAGTRATWNDINAHLAPLPTMTQNGQTVFRETSTGNGWVNDGNDIDIQAVYPSGQVGLDSNATLLQTARNTVGQLTAAWHGGNAPATFYAAAARTGYDPATIMSNLHTEAAGNSYPNMAIHHSGGGIENINVTTSGLDEMLLQSFQNDVKVFADWPANTSGKFGDLMAAGNFLISSGKTDTAVQYVRAVSQKGGNLVVTNPWPGSAVQVYRNGSDAGTVSGTKLTLGTSAGETVTLAPPGTSYATVQTELAQPLGSGTGTGGTSSSFSSGSEPGDPAPAWIDTVDTAGGNDVGVVGINSDSAGPQTGPRTGETSRTGGSSLMYAGSASGSSPHAYLKVYDLSGSPLAIGTSKTLGYWIYPQSNASTPWVPAGSTESECVAVDLVFTDNSTLRDSGAVDQNGNLAHPAHQCGHLTLDTWNHVTVNLATKSAGKQIARILVGYDHPGGSGGYRGYIDDLTVN